MHHNLGEPFPIACRSGDSFLVWGGWQLLRRAEDAVVSCLLPAVLAVRLERICQARDQHEFVPAAVPIRRKLDEEMNDIFILRPGPLAQIFHAIGSP